MVIERRATASRLAYFSLSFGVDEVDDGHSAGDPVYLELVKSNFASSSKLYFKTKKLVKI